MDTAVEVAAVSHRYGDRAALDDVSFTISRGEIFGLLGPNGGGKTTLFRLLTTLLPVQSGRITIGGHDVMANSAGVRARLGITFQSPSLDGKLTVRENLQHQGHLYGMMGAALRARVEQVTPWLGLGDPVAGPGRCALRRPQATGRDRQEPVARPGSPRA
jgi:ABC-2 type transport system ATP-binding protein